MKDLRRAELAAFIIFVFLFVPYLSYAGDDAPPQADAPSGEIPTKAAAEQASTEDQPLGSVRGDTYGDVFGRRGGFVHPFLSVTEYFTDNVFYTNSNKRSDFATIL